jgi:hypothetical protein
MLGNGSGNHRVVTLSSGTFVSAAQTESAGLEVASQQPSTRITPQKNDRVRMNSLSLGSPVLPLGLCRIMTLPLACVSVPAQDPIRHSAAEYASIGPGRVGTSGQRENKV